MPRKRRASRSDNGSRYCSRACRARKVNALDQRLERAILGLLAQRPRGGNICPSEAVRHITGDDGWRTLMEPARRAARRLAHAGRLEITQRGRVVDPCAIRGPVRLRLARTADMGSV